MSMDRLRDYVIRATTVYRKGDVVKISDGGSYQVITVDAFPALPEGSMSTVDCHFVHVGFTEALAELSHQEFYDLVHEAWLQAQGMPLDFWATGPGYIAIGSWIGDQTLAFQLMACIHAHGLGTVITPKALGITGPQADQMAGVGYVMISGLREPAEPASLPLHRTEANVGIICATCDGGGCPDCTDVA